MADGGIFGPSAAVIQKALDEQAIKREQDRNGAYAGIGTSFGQSFARGLMGGLGVDPSTFLAPEVQQAQQREQLQQGLQAEGIDPMSDPRAVQMAVKAGQYDLAQQLHTLQQQNRLGDAQLTQQEAAASVAAPLAQEQLTQTQLGTKSKKIELDTLRQVAPYAKPGEIAKLNNQILQNRKLQQELATFGQADPAAAAEAKSKLLKNRNDLERDFSKQFEKVAEVPVAAIDQADKALDLLNSRKGGASDYAATVTFLKALDPRSVARESEVDAVSQAAGLAQGLISAWLKAGGKGQFSEVSRRQLVDALTTIKEAARLKAQGLSEDMTTQLEQYKDTGVRVEAVLPRSLGRVLEAGKSESKVESSGVTSGGIKYRIKVK